MNIAFAGRTDTGRVRVRNEDALLQRPERGLFVVADGMGGHAAGDIASRIAVDVVDERTAESTDDPVAQLTEAALAAHEAILKAADANPALSGMGTTLTALRVVDGDGCAVVHVGDSRAYRWHRGALEQVTRDQTWVQDQVEAGALSRAQARVHPFSAMLTCALGIGDAELDVQVVRSDCEPGDVFLLCSDGLTAAVDDDDLRSTLAEHDDLGQAAAALVRRANEAGGPDNITVALVRIAPGH